MVRLQKPAFAKVDLDDDICIYLIVSHVSSACRLILTIDGGHDEAYLCSIGGTGEMSIYLFGLVLVQRHEAIQDVIACRRIVRSTFSNIRTLVRPSVRPILVELAFIVWKIILHRADR